MIPLRLSYIEDRLSAIDLEALACSLYMENGYTKKIRARDMLLGFLLLYNQGEISREPAPKRMRMVQCWSRSHKGRLEIGALRDR